MNKPFDSNAYLQRMGATRPDRLSAEALKVLQRRHLETVPFENLDIHQGRPLSLSPEALFDKIVGARRGGFCYELNGLFALLLEDLGFDVTRLSCRTLDGEGVPSAPHDHLALLVEADGRWLVDVGFGEAFPEPLDLDQRDVQWRSGRGYRISREGSTLTYWELGPDDSWAAQYLFTLDPYTLDAFSGMCSYHQTSPESPFTRKRLCTRLTCDGRITLRDDRLIQTRAGKRTESRVQGETQFRELLTEHFGVDLDAGATAPAIG